MDKISLVMKFFEGAFCAFSENESDVNVAFSEAYRVTKKMYSNQPIYRATLVAFDKWYKENIEQEPDCDNDGSNTINPDYSND